MNPGCDDNALWLEDNVAFIRWTRWSWTAIYLKNAAANERSIVFLQWWDLI